MLVLLPALAALNEYTHYECKIRSLCAYALVLILVFDFGFKMNSSKNIAVNLNQ